MYTNNACHSAPIVGLDFDKRIIMSVSSDGMIRRWPFRIHGQSQHEEKWHIIAPNEHIANIAKMYDTTVAKIKEWNNIKDLYKLYIGQRLIVQKTETQDKDDLQSRKSQEG